MPPPPGLQNSSCPATALRSLVEPGFSQTCWRGLSFSHPPEWEPAVLSGPTEDRKCVLVDRRHERLMVEWQTTEGVPDVTLMYDKLRRSLPQETPGRALTGVPDWRGVIVRPQAGEVTRAGRHFKGDNCLVRVVLTWPGGRDAELERRVLGSVGPLGGADPLPWRAAGLSVHVPAAFELAEAENLVGRIAWEFHRCDRASSAVRVERLGMSRYWLKTPLLEWLEGRVPKGSRRVRDGHPDCGGHPGVELVTRRGGTVAAAAGRSECRLDRAWQCPPAERVYWVACWHRSPREPEFPAGLGVECCREVRLGVKPT